VTLNEAGVSRKASATVGKAMKYKIYQSSNEKEEETFLKFWNENHEKNLDGKYEWMYKGNPAGKAVIFLVNDNEEQECIGCLAVFPRSISVNGVDLRTGVAGDLLVHKRHRVLAPALKLEKKLVTIIQENEFDLIYGFPNKSAEPVMKRAGFKCLGPNTRIAKIVRTSEQLQRLRFCKCLNKPLSALLDVALKLFAFETWYRFKGGLVCEEVSDFDRRFDDLWMRSKTRFQVVGERTSELLRWKYLEKPDTEYRIHAIFSSNKAELKGYIIHCMDENSISIKDLVLPEDETASRIFVSNFLRHVKKQPISSVVMQFLENEEIIDSLKRFGFVKRKNDWSVYYYCSEDLLKRFPVLEDSNAWLLTNFDMDN
jgi:hypothetical protein